MGGSRCCCGNGVGGGDDCDRGGVRCGSRSCIGVRRNGGGSCDGRWRRNSAWMAARVGDDGYGGML